jgi:hypothetical protein
MMIDSSHYYRQHWYWAGEANYRLNGNLELTTIPQDEWRQVETDAVAFWDEIAGQSERSGRVVEIIKKYNADMELAGRSVPLLDHPQPAGRVRRGRFLSRSRHASREL